MKTSAVVRMIAWGIVAVLLLGVLIVGINGGLGGIFGWMNRIEIPFWNGGEYSSYDDSSYTLGGGSAAAADIRNISVDWVAGSVEIIPVDGDEIRFEETSDRELNEDSLMRYRVEGNTLRIRFARQRIPLARLFGSLRKSLTVYLPRGIALDDLSVNGVSNTVRIDRVSADRISVDSVSGKVELNGVTAEELHVVTVSGGIRGEDCTADSLRAEAVSGGIDLGGDFETVRSESVSGGVTVKTASLPSETRMETISGGLTLVIPENDGFTVRYDKISGGFNCDFEADISKNDAVYKDGGNATIRLETVSGGMNIRRG